VAVLRLAHRAEGPGHVVHVALDGMGAPQSATARFEFGLSAQDREDLRWYLEDYLQYPVDPAPLIARRVEERMAAVGGELFRAVFESSRDTIRLWDAVAGSLGGLRVEIAAGVEGAAAVPWELLRDPVSDGVLALRAGAFVRTQPEAAAAGVGAAEAAAAGVGTAGMAAEATGPLRVLLVICRPGGQADVPFRSVASHLVRLSRGAREALRLDVLRPPTFAQLTRVLGRARDQGEPYQVVHFDGHGAWLDAAGAAGQAPAGELSREVFSLVSPARPGSRGYLVFEEDPARGRGHQLVDGPALGTLLADAGVPVLVLNACRSAHADLVAAPETVTAEQDAHRRVRAYGSLAQEVMDAGVAGVVAMRYNVYVVTAARFIGEAYLGLLAGRPLGAAVGAARRQLAADPVRQVSAQPRSLQDWVVPVVYEAAPLALRPRLEKPVELSLRLSQAEAGQERASLDPGLPGGPDVGFFGRDESLLALDRAFDAAPVVLLHAWAGAGKSATAVEFARWYQLTGGVEAVLFASFEHHLTLPRLLDQVGVRFGPALADAGVAWAVLDDAQRRDVALQVLAQVRVLWVWDNVEPVAGFPAGAVSAWTADEQAELAAFLRDLQRYSEAKVLLTSRRSEWVWLGDLPARVELPPMPMLERLELARAVAGKQPGGERAFLEVTDWRPLLEFTQGNPLTVTILARQVLRERRTTPEQIQAFVQQLRNGAATVTDDGAQGRGASLAASLDYGFGAAFTDHERAVLALLALFQGFADVAALCTMGAGDDPVGPVAGLDRDAGIALLDRAADVGLLTAWGEGYYSVHPAIPWHLQGLFRQYYGAPGGAAARHAARIWAEAISELADYCHREYAGGDAEVLDVLRAEEANLLRARQLALGHGWPDLLIGLMQGLRALYGETGRAVEWRRLVAELVPEFTDPATGGARPGLGKDWAILTEYRVQIAHQARDWPEAEQLQQANITWRREQAAEALAAPADARDDEQRAALRTLAVACQQLGDILRDQDRPGCVDPYLEACGLAQRAEDRRLEGVVAFNLGRAYEEIAALRDLDDAQRWYQRASDLFDARDVIGRAATTFSLGSVAFRRYRDAHDAGTEDDRTRGYVKDAVAAFHRALELYPTASAAEIAVVHNALGSLYAETRETRAALRHFQQAIQYSEHVDDRYGAGEARYNAAITLAGSWRRDDALLYAQAALRDFDAVGAGAAAYADKVRRFISQLESPGEPTNGETSGI
jgi:tetratricopeptide (TPR) repeat protein